MKVSNHSAVQRVGLTPLDEACKTGNFDLVNIVLRSGAKPDPQTLTWACKGGNVEIIKTVNQQGAVPDHETLNVACTTKKVEVVQWAIFCGAKASDITVELARRSGNSEIIKLVSNALPKVEKPALALAVHPKPASQKRIFGAAEWRNYIGDPGIVPPIPEGLEQFLSANPSYALYLIPEKINGKSLDDKRLIEFVKNPRQGNPVKEIKLEHYTKHYKYGNYWVLMSVTPLKGTGQKYFEDQNRYIKSFGYEPPFSRELTICLCMEYIRNGQWYDNYSRSIGYKQNRFHSMSMSRHGKLYELWGPDSTDENIEMHAVVKRYDL